MSEIIYESSPLSYFNFFYNDNGYYHLMSLNEEAKSASVIVIPDMVDGIPVEVIGGETFVQNKNLTTIVIPKTVKFIMSYAFTGSDNLNTVHYMGTEQEWNAISINYTGNDILRTATINYNNKENDGIMPNTKKYVSLDKLYLYDQKIKAKIATDDAAILADAKHYADNLASNYEPSGSVASAKTELQGKIDAVEVKADEAKATADQAQGEVDALEVLVGTIPEGATATDIVGYIDEKTSHIASDTALAELTGRVGQAETDIDTIQVDLQTIKDDYLKASDKAELQGSITTNADAIALIKEDVDAFFLDADMTEQAKDTLKEIQQYISSDETGASQMAASIKQNSDDIDAIEGRLNTAESKIATNEQSIATLQNTDTTLSGRIDALEGAIGDSGSVTGDIATAKQEAIDAAAVDATTKANAAESNAKAHTDTEVGKDRARLDALETDTHSHANADVLDGITTDKVVAWDKVTDKADQTSLQSEIDRATAKEGELLAAIEAFVEVSEEEINGLFA